MKSKTILFLGDGMADEPLEALGGKTPLQAAQVPNMDWIAAHGRCGEMLTLPEGFPTSSDVANMSVLGGDLAKELCGRGPLEAASQGIPMGPDDVVFRMNLVTVAPDGTLADFSGGHIGAAEQQEAIALLNAKIAPTNVAATYAVTIRIGTRWSFTGSPPPERARRITSVAFLNGRHFISVTIPELSPSMGSHIPERTDCAVMSSVP